MDASQMHDGSLFLDSLNDCFVTELMILTILHRWGELGKPLLMIPKDFRDRILQDIAPQIPLNYRKWLV